MAPLLRLLAGARPDDRVAEAARRALEDEKLQRALPGPIAPPAFDLPAEPLVLLVKLLLVAGLVVLAILAGTWLARRLRPAAGDGALPDEAAPRPALEVHPEDAHALAAAGRHAEAIHLLLLETLAALARATRLSPALTSREILARASLPPPARQALAGLVLAVEVSRFGGDAPGPRDFDECLERFEAFRAGWRGAP